MNKGALIFLWFMIITGCVCTVIHGEAFIFLTIFCGLFLIAVTSKIYERYNRRNNGKQN